MRLELYIFWVDLERTTALLSPAERSEDRHVPTHSKTMQVFLMSLELMPIQDFLANYFITDIVQPNKFGV